MEDTWNFFKNQMQQNGYLVANATMGAIHDYFEKMVELVKLMW
jgi:hypothetical protein